MANRKLEIWLHVGIWFIWILGYILAFNNVYPLSMSVLRTFANVLPLMILFYINLYLVNWLLEKKQLKWYLLSAVFLVGLIMVVRVNLNRQFPPIDYALIQLNETSSFRLGAVITNLIILALSAFYQILQNRYKNEQRNLEIISQQQEAQIQFLRAQINPHFLFNTLNNIYSLAVIKSDKTADMVLQLSNLLRYVIYDGKLEQVALQKEIAHIYQFIELFQLRNEEALDIQFSVSGSTERIVVEPMILIPLVENCFKHCDFDSNPEAFIRMKLSVEKEQLYFHTLNSKNDADQQKDSVGGVGLTNIRKRLNLKYPKEHHLKIENQATTFEIDLQLTVHFKQTIETYGANKDLTRG